MQREGGRYAQLCAWGVALSVFVVGLLGTTGTAHAGAVSAPPNNLGLVGYWSLNEGSGTVAGDFSGSGNTGSFNSDPQWTDGRYDQGLVFDGTDDFLSINNSPELDVTTSYTLSAWIKPDVVDNYNLVFFRGTGSASEIEVYGRQSDTVILHNRSGSGGTMTYKTGPAFTANTWMHVAVTYNNSASEWKVYYDGVEQNFTLANGNGENPADNDSGWRIGKNDGSFGNSEFNGTIDEIRIYNRALSASEVRDLHQRGLATVKQPDRTGLIGYWSLDDGGGSIAGDSSGNGKDGTLKNMDAATDWVAGRYGGALEFDGTDDYVEIPDMDAVTDAADDVYTMSAWIKTSVASDFLGVVETSRYNGIFLCSDGGWSVQSNGDNAGTCASGTRIDDGEWHHLVGVYKEGERYIGYEDGVEVFNVPTSDTEGDNSELGRIGDRKPGGDYFTGIIDDVRIYNRELSAGEVEALYETTQHTVNSSRNTVLTDGLVGLWSFDGPDIDDTTAYDRSGGGNDGTLHGSLQTTIGKVGQSLDFDGDTGRIVLGSRPVSNTPTITYTAWVKADTLNGNWRAVIAEDESTNGPLRLYGDSSAGAGQVWLHHGKPAATGVVNVDAADAITTDEWYFLAGVLDGVNAHIYINGDLKKSAAYSANVDSALHIGVNENNQHEWDGTIDQVRIYDRALSTNEIMRLYRIGR